MIYHSRKYSVNEKFFDGWSEEMAYVLGFWFADGYMRVDRSYRIAFFSNDKQILRAIRDVMKSSHPFRRNENCWQLIVHSKYLYQRLSELGGLRKKSRIMRFPKIPKAYMPDFIRGYFDGDGSVFYVHYRATKNGKLYKELRSNFTSGSKDFLEKLKIILVKEVGVATKVLGEFNEGHSLKLGYGTKDTLKLLRYMYHSGFSIALDRKAKYARLF